MTDYKMLVKEAYEAQKNAYVPYSNWAVGACLLAKDGRLFHGCNIESSTFSPTVCAERTAIFSAVAQGVKDFCAIAVVGNAVGTPIGKGDYCPPCGVCRQVMAEFCNRDFEIIIAKNYDEYQVYTLDQLMPLISKPLEKRTK